MGMGWINSLLSAAMEMLMELAQGFPGASLIQAREGLWVTFRGWPAMDNMRHNASYLYSPAAFPFNKALIKMRKRSPNRNHQSAVTFLFKIQGLLSEIRIPMKVIS